MELLENFTPKCLDSIIDNKKEINQLISCLNDNLIKLICLTGPTGCGKTMISKIVLDHLNLNVLEITRDNNTNKELNKLLYNFINNETIESFFSKRKKVVFIDSIDILLQTEKNIITIINQNLSNIISNNLSILITCKINGEKKLLEFKENIKFIKIYYPHPQKALAPLISFFNSNNVSYDETHLLDLLQKCRGNIRETILNIHTSIYDKQLLDQINKYRDLNTFSLVQSFFKETPSSKDIKFIIKDDISLMSYILYENLPNELYNNKNFRRSDNDIISTYKKINNYYSISTQFENYMYINNDWDFNNYISIMKLWGTSHTLENIKRKKKEKVFKLNHSQILSKISHKNMIHKKISIMIHNNFISYNELISIIDTIVTQSNYKENIKQLRKNKTLDVESLNLISIYDKYFNNT